MSPKKNTAEFVSTFQAAFKFKGASLTLGAAVHDGKAEAEAPVSVPLRMMNRHGLIAGATGTGKTKTLQLLAEGLSEAGVPVLLMDIKGDLSGLAAAGEGGEKVDERHKRLGIPWKPLACPVELLSLSEEPGARLRATVSEFGPLLLARVLELNDTQSSVLTVLFQYCDGHQLPLLDLKDLKAVLQWAAEDGQKALKDESGQISPASLNTILRKVNALEAQGAESFFGEPSFEVADLLKKDPDGKGIIHILRLVDLQQKPQLFSTFMLSLLSEAYEELPEEGDLDKPKLVIMIDEAHLLFGEASKALLQKLDTVVKLIRSKGVGLYFCTQVPGDVPEAVLSQLGLKIQHALRAFTAKDRQQLKLAAQNYADSPWYDNEELLTSVGIGEAAISVLDEKGNPTPVVHCLLRAPSSRMGVLSPGEISRLVKGSDLVEKYSQDLDRESAYERLRAKVVATAKAPEQRAPEAPAPAAPPRSRGDSVMTAMLKTAGRVVASEVTRGILGALTGRRSRGGIGGLFR